MINFIVLGKDVNIIAAVLRSVRSFTDAKCMVVASDSIKGMRWSGLYERLTVMQFDGRDDDRFASLVGRLGEQTSHLMLIPCDAEGIRMANRVRGRLAINVIPIPDAPTLATFNDGLHFHQFCLRNSLAVPAMRVIASNVEADFDALAAQLGLPFTLKPARCSNSADARMIHTKAQLAQAMSEAHASWPLLAQRHIEGSEIGFCLLADRGMLSAFALEQVSDSHISFLSNPELERMASRLCHAAAYHGAMRLDARIERQTGKIYLTGVTPSFWASLPASVWCGLNFVAESVRQTPRMNGIPRLTAGISHLSHPLARPSLWPLLFHDAGERGRLLKAMMLDMHAIGRFTHALASGVRRQLASPLDSLRNLPAPHGAMLAKQDSRNASGSAAG